MMTKITRGDLQASHCGGIITTSGQLQSMRNLVCHRSMSGKTCLRLVEILGLSVTMTGNLFSIFTLYSMMWQVKISHDKSKFSKYQSDCLVVWK